MILPFALPAIASTVLEFAKSKNGLLIIGIALVSGWLYWGHLRSVAEAERRGERTVIARSEKAGAENNAEAEKVRADARRGDPFVRLCQRGDCRSE